MCDIVGVCVFTVECEANMESKSLLSHSSDDDSDAGHQHTTEKSRHGENYDDKVTKSERAGEIHGDFVDESIVR